MSLPQSPALPDRAPRQEPGMVGRTVLKLLTVRATVASVRTLSPRFLLVALQSDAFRGVAWAPGDKMQIRVSGMAFRTFTPFRSAGADDVLEFIGHVHGDAPGADWLWNLAAGDTCNVMGPRRSMNLGALQQSTVFFGDETSLGLAIALCGNPIGGLDTHFLFEATDAEGARTALAALGRAGVRNAGFVERRFDDNHLVDIEASLLQYALADRHRQYVLSGKSTSIQRLQRSLKVTGVKPSQMLVKAYWAPGKTGLD